MKVPARFSMTPTAKPPSTAPPGLVSPPSTAPAKPYSSTPNIMFGSRNTIGAISMPAIPPIAAAMPQPSAVIQPTRIPTRRADSGVLAAAPSCSPRPCAAKEQIKDPEQHDSHADHAGLVRADQDAAQKGAGAERGWKSFDRVIPEVAVTAVQDAEQRDERDKLTEDRRVMQGLEHDPLN